jgi:2-polyprenyl-6-hydroxyphenyl methylase / 3-demethylubiquinone-9 3-methyltransferase
MEKSLETPVNNGIYDELGERWYAAHDDPVALLRAESRLRNPWVAERILAERGRGARVLDVGCGAGFLSNYLATQGFDVTGLDASQASLDVAARHDGTGKASYLLGDALRLPFQDASFDVVCAMDFLEHVEDPAAVVAEVARVLRPGGSFFFHTFNRNPVAWLVIIKGVEWFVKNTPRHMHVLRLFIKPQELQQMCAKHSLHFRVLHGSEPVIFSWAFWRMLLTRVVPPDFRFRFSKSTLLAYTGYAALAVPVVMSSAKEQAKADVAKGAGRHRELQAV